MAIMEVFTRMQVLLSPIKSSQADLSISVTFAESVITFFFININYDNGSYQPYRQFDPSLPTLLQPCRLAVRNIQGAHAEHRRPRLHEGGCTFISHPIEQPAPA